MCKTCPTKIESYLFSPKVLWKLCLTFQANSNHSFKSFFDCIHFLWACFHLNAAFFSALRIVSSLADCGIPALTFIFYLPISSWRILVWSIIFLFCQTDIFDDCPWFYFLLSTAKSPILFFICLHIVSSLRVLSRWSHLGFWCRYSQFINNSRGTLCNVPVIPNFFMR